MSLSGSWRSGLLWLLLCSVVLAWPAAVFAGCRVVEYPDYSEVVCEDDAVPQTGQPPRKKQPKYETTFQREFTFYSPARAGSKIALSGDLTPNAIASPGDVLLSYRFDDYKDRVYTTSTASFVYEERGEGASFTIREDGSGPLAPGPKTTNVIFNDKQEHLLLIPFGSGCSSAGDAVLLKMIRMDGSQLHYRIVLPSCLSKLVEQSIPD